MLNFEELEQVLLSLTTCKRALPIAKLTHEQQTVRGEIITVLERHWKEDENEKGGEGCGA